MLNVEKRTDYTVCTWEGRAIIGNGNSELEALTKYMINLDEAIEKTKSDLAALERLKVEAEETLKTIKK